MLRVFVMISMLFIWAFSDISNRPSVITGLIIMFSVTYYIAMNVDDHVISPVLRAYIQSVKERIK